MAYLDRAPKPANVLRPTDWPARLQADPPTAEEKRFDAEMVRSAEAQRAAVKAARAERRAQTTPKRAPAPAKTGSASKARKAPVKTR